MKKGADVELMNDGQLYALVKFPVGVCEFSFFGVIILMVSPKGWLNWLRSSFKSRE
jgi:hypothetical protein